MNIKKVLPFLSWFPLSGEQVRSDLIAGITVSLVLIPQSMAYAQLAGMPPYYGLYAAFIPGFIGALWGSSYHLASGPTAMTALLIASSLVPFAAFETPEYVRLAMVLALLVGVCRLIIGSLKLTFLINLISQPVIRGFTNAGAIIIALSQFSKIVGLPMSRSNFFLRDIWEVFASLGNTHIPTLLVGILALVLIFFLRKYIPKAPFALVATAAATLFVYFLGLHAVADNSGRTVAVIGNIPAGLPAFSLPEIDIALSLKLLPGAIMVLFVGFMEVCSVTKAISAKSRQRINLNQEMIGQGLSATLGSFFQCFPTGGSFSRSALYYESGGKTGLSSIFAGGFVVLTLLFLTRYLKFLPHAALAAIIIMAVIKLIDFRIMIEYWKVNVLDGIVATCTFVATMLFAPNMVNGILIGTGVSIAFHLYKTMKPRVAIIKDPELPIIQFDGRLYFASAPYFEDAVLKVLADYPDARSIIVQGSGINEIDATGETLLRDIVRECREEGSPLAFVGFKHQVLQILWKTGLYEEIGKDRFFSTLQDALDTLKGE